MNHLWLQLADWTAKATLTIALAWFVARLLRGRPKLRRMAWVAALACILFLPLAGTMSRTEPALIRLKNEAMPAPSQSRVASGVSESLPLVLWLVGAGVTALSFGAGYIGLIGATRRSRPFSANLQGLPDPGMRRRWTLRIADTPSVSAAITFGIIRPVVLLPAVAETWSEEELRTVLLHEMGHIRSLDSLVQLVAQAECAIFWFNPAAWLAAKALRSECEANADEAVMEAGVKATDYAAMLLGFAAGVTGRQPHRLALSIVRTPRIEQRIRAIVRSSTHMSRPLTALNRFVGALLVAALILAMGSVRLAEAQSQPSASGHSAEWWRGYQLGLAHKASQDTPARNDKLGLSPEVKREVESLKIHERELQAIRNRKPPP